MPRLSPPVKKGGLLFAFAVLVLGLVAWAAARLVPLPERLTMAGSPVLRWQDGQVAHLQLAPDQRWRVAVGLEEVDPVYVAALLRLEDRRFWVHPGVDPLAIGRAAFLNLARGEVVSGASTITMQLVRLCEPRPRTLRSKAIEALRAMQFELRMSKEEILSAYIDLVPYGGNLEGVEAASQAFFGHSARMLTAAEIATLLAIPQDPAHRAPSAANAARLRAARDEIALRLLELGLLERHLERGPGPGVPGAPGAVTSVEEVLAGVQASEVPTLRRPMPRALPHAAAWLLGEGQGQDRTTTLEAGVQGRVEGVVARAAAELRRHGIDDIALVVVEHGTGEVRALVGGVDFWADRPGAQIPSFLVPRSPGSALKPFLFAMALDRGLVLPEQLVLDVPTSYGGYAPTNYDGDYQGLVALDEALSRSLNVPFVRLLEQVGVEPFLGQLRSLGARSLDRRPGHYGLSAIVGGVELSPLEMAGMYATLARGGSALPLRVRAEQAAAERALPLSSPGATWLTTRILSRRDRPDFPSRADLSAVPRHIFWKTGTSFGNRDAWAIGAGARFTVAVWLGNLDRRPSAWLVGADAAGPILFDALDALGDGHGADPRPLSSAPGDLRPVDVCALSGQLPGPACPDTRPVLALERKVPPATCALHREVELDRATGLAVGPGCRDGRDTVTELRVDWPPSVRRWLSTRYQDLPAAPELDPSCRLAARGEGPRLLSGRGGETIVLIPGVPPERQELALEAEASDDGLLTWFVDGRELGRAPAGERVWWTPSPGEHEILVTDRHGRTDRGRLRVRDAPDMEASR